MMELMTDTIKIVRNKGTPDEVTFENIQCNIQPELGFFDINTDVKKGDFLIVPDLDEPKVVIKKNVNKELIPHIEVELLDLSEFNEKENSKSSVYNQITISDSQGVVIDSTNVSINIQDAFNKIYQQLDDENPENKEEIQVKIKELEEEVQKEEIDKSKVQNIYNWLKNNANWTIPTITQIVTTCLFGTG